MKNNNFETCFEMFAKCLRALICCIKNLLEIDVFYEKNYFEVIFEMYLLAFFFCNKNQHEIDFLNENKLF